MNRRFGTNLLAFLFGGIALIVGLKGYTVALLGSLLVLLAMGFAWLWNHFVFAKLTLERTLSQSHTYFGRPVTMQLAITNRKVLPLFGLKVRFSVSTGISWTPAKAVEPSEAGYDIFQEVFHLNWYERRSRVYEINPTRRGRFRLEQGSLAYSDPFGFFSNKKHQVLAENQLIVFPKIVPLGGISSLDTYLFGSRAGSGWIFVDPLNRVGTRPYASTDSARMINWKATARHIETQVNVEKPSFDQEVCIVLDQPPHLPWWTASVSNHLEIAIMTVASLVQSYSEAGYKVKLVTNLVSQTRGTSPLPNNSSRGRAQCQQQLTNLALLQSFSLEPIAQVLPRMFHQMGHKTAVVLVTTASGPLDSTLVKLARRLSQRSKVAIIRVLEGGESLPREVGPADKRLAEWYIEGGVPWNDVDHLELS